MGGMLTAAREALLPGLCPHCEAPLGGDDRGLCRRCRSRLVPRAGAACGHCGLPVEDAAEPCLHCLRHRQPQSATVIWGEHDDVLRTAILALKHRSHDELARPLGERLAALVGSQPWAGKIDAVCGIPAHPLRTIKRPWSAAELVARTVARALEQPLLRPLRRRAWRRQTGRSRADRLTLPVDSFSAAPVAGGRRLLLIDDVTTTGTTIRRASGALLRAGAAAVYCAVVAHAPGSRSTP